LGRGQPKRQRIDTGTSTSESDDVSEIPATNLGDDYNENPSEAPEAVEAINALPGKRYRELLDHPLGSGVTIITELGAFICKYCGYVVRGNALARHFIRKHPTEFNDDDIKAVATLHSMPYDDFPPTPPPGCYPPPGLPQLAYWKCNGCQGLFCPKGVVYGRHTCTRRGVQEVTVCQWKPRNYFEVTLESDTNLTGQQTVEQWARAKLIQLGDPLTSEVLPTTHNAANIHPFLVRSGWADFFKPIKLADLEKLKGFSALPPMDDPLRNLMHRIFRELHHDLTAPQFYEIQYILFASKGYVGILHITVGC
jgi:hypothetical protein